jgi:tetratricopeptide (TPR) repeat protein
MSWWHRLTGGTPGRDGSSRAPNYLAEAIDLEARGDYSNALTSYRLALRERPDDPRVLQNIAIAFSKTAQPEEAIRHYRRALEIEPSLAGAHYGLAFLLLKRAETAGCAAHLEAFLRTTKRDAESAAFVAHAERTLAALTGEAPGPDDLAPTARDGWLDDHAHPDDDPSFTDRNTGPAEPGPGR